MHRSRGKRDAEFGNYTMVDIDGNDPNDEIDENLPLEVRLGVSWFSKVNRIRVYQWNWDTSFGKFDISSIQLNFF